MDVSWKEELTKCGLAGDRIGEWRRPVKSRTSLSLFANVVSYWACCSSSLYDDTFRIFNVIIRRLNDVHNV